ncbi:MAG: hypothetical protein AAF900_00705 [Bacteroidota bacterium]
MIKLRDIAQEYLRSIPIATDHKASDLFFEEEEQNNAEQQAMRQDINKGKLTGAHIPDLNKKESADIIFTKIFSKSHKVKEMLQTEKSPVLDLYSWQDLNLIAGQQKSPEKNVLQSLKRTKTLVGECAMATQIVNPSTNLETITTKQKCIQAMLKDKATTKKIEEKLSNIQQGEAQRLAFWKKDHVLTHPMFKKELNKFYFKRFGLARYNQSGFALQLGKFWSDFLLNKMFITSFLFMLLTLLFFGYNHVYNIVYIPKQHHYCIIFNRDSTKRSFSAILLAWTLRNTMIVPFLPHFYPLQWDIESATEQINVSGFDLLRKGCWSSEEFTYFLFLGSILSSIGTYFWYRAIKNFRKNRSTLNFLAANLAPFQALVRNANALTKLILAHPELKQYYGKNLRYTRKLLEEARKGNTEIGKLIKFLHHVKLHDRWYFFNHTGNLLALYERLKENKKKLSSLIYEMGELDAQYGIVKIIEEHNNLPKDTNKFVFGSFLDTPADAPIINAEGLWHPSLPAKQAISNDLNMDSANGMRTCVITGPNTGGKTTYILKSTINIICQQVWGIAAAKSLQQSVFHKIITYVNPAQDLARGLSLAEASMEVIKKHTELLKTTKKPILATLDEILGGGLDRKFAEPYACDILKERNKNYTNCLTLLTTHMEPLTKLAEKDKHIYNKKVEVIIPGTEGRPFDPTYKIHDGVATQSVVGALLKHKGIIAEDLDAEK